MTPGHVETFVSDTIGAIHYAISAFQRLSVSAFRFIFRRRPTFSLCLATARPDMAGGVIYRWNHSAAGRDHEFIICVDQPKVAGAFYLEFLKHDMPVKLVIQRKEPFNCVRAWNTAAAAARGKVLLLISDDFFPPENWDQFLKKFKDGQWIEQNAAVLVKDGPHDSNVCTLPILTRHRYRKLGHALYPGYESMFSDTDLTAHAEHDGVLLRAKHLTFRHGHPDAADRQRDAVDLSHSSVRRYDRGQRLFNARQQFGFKPLNQIPSWNISELDPEKQIARLELTASFLVNRDDFCLREAAEALITQGVRRIFFAVPDHNWYRRPTPQADIDTIFKIADELAKRHGVEAQARVFNVLHYWDSNKPMRDYEGATRNAVLEWLWNHAHTHCLIVDGDELWVDGAVGMVANVIEKTDCDSINAGCIPVIGLPGYPVENARDTVCVYIRKGHRFASARSPLVNNMRKFGTIGQRLLYHFTATRRTREEIIEKHLLSNHSDDPLYNMHDWIRDTLPNIRPGLRDAHMFKKYSLWPVVRDWIPGEIESMPEAIRGYLGEAKTESRKQKSETLL